MAAEQPDFDKALGRLTGGMTESEQGAAMAHEMFITQVAAGFSEAQAIYLTAAMVTGNPGKPPIS